MCKIGIRYKLLSPIRLLLPAAGVLYIIPFIFPQLYTVVLFPLCYFFASYFTFLNFPCVVETLHKKPMYFEDLALIEKRISSNLFQKVYTVVMSFLLALIFAIVADYVLVQGIHTKSTADIVGTIGANILVFMKVQNEVGRNLVGVCHTFKDVKVVRTVLGRLSSSDDGNVPSIEMSQIGNSSDDSSTPSSAVLTHVRHVRSKSCSDTETLEDFVIDVGTLRVD